MVLPAPFKPRISRRSPRPTSNDTSLKTGGPPKPLRRPSASSTTAPGTRRCRELHRDRAFLLRAGHGVALQTRGAGVERLRDACALGRLAPHAIGELLEPIDLGALTGREPFEPHFVGGPGGAVLGVRALVLDHLALIEVQDPGDRRVEQLEVVADHEQRAAVGTQEAHEPLLGVVVEVVRRLVEEQRLASREEDPGQLHSAALATREGVDREVEAVIGEAETRRDPPDLRIRGVATGIAELLLGDREAARVAFRAGLLDLQAELLDACRGGIEATPGEHVRHRGGFHTRTAGTRVLGEKAQVVGPEHHPGRSGRLTGEHLQETGLAGAVATDEADLVARAQAEGRLEQGGPSTDLD